MNKLSQDITEIIKAKSSHEKLTLKDFTSHFGHRSITFLIILVSLPIALPFTPAGVNTPFALVCIFLSLSFIANKKDFKLPKFLESKTIPFKPNGKFFAAMTKMLVWIEHILKPRYSKVTESKWSKPFLGGGILASAVVMLIPLPIINSLSSLIVLLTAMGIVAKDGLISLISAVAGYLLLIASIAIIIYGVYVGQSFFG